MKSEAHERPIKNEASPPSRGAWIEISWPRHPRNRMRSPPSRGAWIEIRCQRRQIAIDTVAPLAGGVD